MNFIFFKNDKGDNINRPDFKCSFKDDSGVWHNVGAIWEKSSKTGNTYLSLTLDEAEMKAYQQDQALKQLEYRNRYAPRNDNDILLKPKKDEEIVPLSDNDDLPF